MRNRSVTIWVMAVVLIILSIGIQRTKATGYFTDGGVWSIDDLRNNDYQIENSTTVNLLPNGVFTGWAYVKDSSQLNILGGLVGDDVFAEDNSQVTMSDGAITNWLYTSGSSQVYISGGVIGGIMYLSGNSMVTLEGSSFQIDGSPINYGIYTNSDYSNGLLTGMLNNGDMINNSFHLQDSGTLVITPEPTTLLLFGLGAVRLRSRQAVMLRRRK